ncbi:MULTISPECIES: hypothetical protein [Photorhabdus]|uniref:hypothetical protein n=1 Tax=Photorhabdus TaxID=29487 RepID=UPI00030AE2B6|nr:MULTISPECIES: hypothetical protein [Photorhabdus]NDK96627.1 hypothetical protein [Photorhabdus laumondii subsp. laumondii]NDL36401.1 hypothetical protein [Photorhabdus laumondii subsp. laumondii]NDL45586.1 hypothetical protein [Photorhabdus laumondii subsp. laumondii]
MTGVSECSQQRGNLKDDGYIYFVGTTTHARILMIPECYRANSYQIGLKQR